MNWFYTNIDILRGKIIYRGYDIDSGEELSGAVNYQPTIYLSTGNESNYKSLWGVNAEPITLDSIGHFKKYVEELSSVSNLTLYNTDVPLVSQFISDIFPEQHINYDEKMIRTFFIDIETETEDGYPDRKLASERINAITIFDTKTDLYHVFAYDEWTVTNIIDKNISISADSIQGYICSDEVQLLKKFLKFWKNNYPDVVTGWNSDYFDMIYIYRRITNVLSEKYALLLSPWRSIHIRSEKGKYDKEEDCLLIKGVSQLDYYHLYAKFVSDPRESYKLDYIAEYELGLNKKDKGFDTFKESYTKDYQGFIEYNIIDVFLVRELERKLRLLSLAYYISFLAKQNFEDVYSPVRTWENIIFNKMKDLNIVTDAKCKVEGGRYEGAFVLEPVPGFYRWIETLDVTSEYPQVLIGWNMSPETIVKDVPSDVLPLLKYKEADFLNDRVNERDFEVLKKYNLCMAANGTFFSNEKVGILPMVCSAYFDMRSKYKELKLESESKHDKDSSLKYDIIQLALKIMINSLYGACANKYFRYYMLSIAEGITLTGQLQIKTGIKSVNAVMNRMMGNIDKKENYAIMSDTDSIGFTLYPLLKKYNLLKADPWDVVKSIIKLSDTRIVPYIDSELNKLNCGILNIKKNTIFFKREKIGSTGFWVAKKRYAIKTYMNESVRYETPKYAMTGLAAVAARAYPELFRNTMKMCIQALLDERNDDAVNIVNSMKESIFSLPIKDISFPRGLNGIEKYSLEYEGGIECEEEFNGTALYKKGTPKQTKGAIIYNKLIDNLNLSHKYQKIISGDRGRYVSLKQPNPIDQEVIAFISELPMEFGLHDYIDRNYQLHLGLLRPLTDIFKVCGVEMESKAQLDDLF